MNEQQAIEIIKLLRSIDTASFIVVIEIVFLIVMVARRK